jgi:hypothetical protein
MSENRPKRKFWQFHLLTSVILFLTASWMLHLNCRTTQLIKVRTERGYGWKTIGPGWPFHEVYFSPGVSTEAEIDEVIANIYSYRSHPNDLPDNTALHPHFGGYPVVNLLVNLLLLAFLAILSEWLIRRREARKT